MTEVLISLCTFLGVASFIATAESEIKKMPANPNMFQLMKPVIPFSMGIGCGLFGLYVYSRLFKK